MKVFLSLLILSGLALSSVATAGNKTNTMKPTASVSKSCIIQSTDNLVFGSYVPSNGANMMTSGHLKLLCTKGVVATAQPVSGGASMSGNGGSLAYGLYADAAGNNQWGAAANTTANITFSTTLATQTTLYYNSSLSTVTQAQCASAAGAGALYAWGGYNGGSPARGNCYYAFSLSGTPANKFGWSIAPNSYGVYVDGVPRFADTAGYKAGFYITSGNMTSGTWNGVSGTWSFSNITLGSNGLYTLTGTATSAATPVDLVYYSQVSAKQNVAPGVYTDTVMVQVTF